MHEMYMSTSLLTLAGVYFPQHQSLIGRNKSLTWKASKGLCIYGPVICFAFYIASFCQMFWMGDLECCPPKVKGTSTQTACHPGVTSCLWPRDRCRHFGHPAHLSVCLFLSLSSTVGTSPTHTNSRTCTINLYVPSWQPDGAYWFSWLKTHYWSRRPI